MVGRGEGVGRPRGEDFALLLVGECGVFDNILRTIEPHRRRHELCEAEKSAVRTIALAKHPGISSYR
jgi:hypothetical protein